MSAHQLAAYAQLEANDVLFLCSDGYDETASPEGEEFGPERLYATVEQVSASPLQKIADHVHEQLSAFQADAPPIFDWLVEAGGVARPRQVHGRSTVRSQEHNHDRRPRRPSFWRAR